MKRDDELIRKILLKVEDQPAQVGRLREFELPDEDPNAVYYNLKLLDQAGFIEAQFSGGLPPEAFGIELTWEGHDFLDAVRNDSVWKRVRQTVLDQGGGVPFSVMKALAIEYLKDRVGLGGSG